MAITAIPDHTHPRQPRLRPWLKRSRQVVAAASLGLVALVLAPHRASLKRLAEMPLTLIGAGCIDFAAFHLAHGWGWLITGLSLLVIEHMIADSE